MWWHLSHKKELNNANVCSNMDGPRDYHIKWSKSDRERQISYDITYMWNLKKKWIQMNLQNGNRLIDRENKLMVTKGERGVKIRNLGVTDTHYYI